MNLYLLSQTQNQSYNTYDSAVVAAESEEHARATHPSSSDKIRANMEEDVWEECTDEYPRSFRAERKPTKVWRPVDPRGNDWSSRPSAVSVTLIGTAVDGTSAGVICASYNAG